MNILKAKRIRHFLRLSYPLRIVAQDELFKGEYPDLPGCSVIGADLSTLYTQLESRRREWITEHVLDGANVPMPNSHLLPIHVADAQQSQTQTITREEALDVPDHLVTEL